MTESDKIERQREAFIAMRPLNKQSSLLEGGLWQSLSDGRTRYPLVSIAKGKKPMQI
jgi:hypothetical protein